jgi:hypothetical protein
LEVSLIVVVRACVRACWGLNQDLKHSKHKLSDTSGAICRSLMRRIALMETYEM